MRAGERNTKGSHHPPMATHLNDSVVGSAATPLCTPLETAWNDEENSSETLDLALSTVWDKLEASPASKSLLPLQQSMRLHCSRGGRRRTEASHSQELLPLLAEARQCSTGFEATSSHADHSDAAQVPQLLLLLLTLLSWCCIPSSPTTAPSTPPRQCVSWHRWYHLLCPAC